MPREKKEISVDSIIASAGAKMAVAAPPTGNAGADLARAAGSPAPQGNGTTAMQTFETEVMRVTGPIDFEAMKRNAKPKGTIEAYPSSGSSPAVLLPVSNEDAKQGKAFAIAKKTIKKFKVASIEDFISLVDEIKSSL